MTACEACGAQIDIGSRFCGECGAVIKVKTREFGPGAKGKQGATRTKGRDTLRESREARRGNPATVPPPKPPAKSGAAAADPIRTTLKGVASDAITRAPGKPPADAPKPPVPEAKPEPREAVGPKGETRTEFLRLLEEVESGFDAILAPNEEPGPSLPSRPPPADDALPTAENTFDEEQARKLFHDLVVANAQPIRDFMIEVRLGEPSATWIVYCEPAVRAILRSAEGMGRADLVARLRVFLDSLQSASSSDHPVIRGEARERVIDAYSELIVFFPEAFALEAEANARETVIVASLLSQVPALHKVGLDRILATGLASLGLFYVSRAQDLVELTGTAPPVAESIVQRFAEYRRTASEISPVGGRIEERRRLREAVAALMAAHRAYEAAQPGSPDRRSQRRLRAEASAQISLLLARLGEVGRLEQLATLSFQARGESLLAYLDDADRRDRRQD